MYKINRKRSTKSTTLITKKTYFLKNQIKMKNEMRKFLRRRSALGFYCVYLRLASKKAKCKMICAKTFLRLK